jgi:hypothetical protein
LPSVHLARLAVIDDELDEGALHLLRLLPLAWLGDRNGARFDNMPTEFGPLTLGAKLTSDGKELQLEISPHWRIRPERVLLHVPPVSGLERIFLNGRRLEWNRKSAEIPLTAW